MWPLRADGRDAQVKKPPLLFEDLPDGAPATVPTNRVWHGLALVLLIFAATRLVAWTAAYAGALNRVQILNDIAPPIRFLDYEPQLKDPNSRLSRDVATLLLNYAPLVVWDAPHYRSIIVDGYQYTPMPPGTPYDQAQWNIAFFPLYPLTCWALKQCLHMGVHSAMVFVANFSALCSAILLYFYVRRRVDESTALWAVAVVFAWPTACFYSFGYSESMNLLLTVTVMLLADRGQFLLAAVACGLATATRPTAVTLVPAFLLAYWVVRNRSWRWRLAGVITLGAIASAGAAAYAGYLWYEFGTPQVYYDNLRAGWIPAMTDKDWPVFLRMEHIFNGFKYLGRAFRQFPLGLINFIDPRAWNVPLTLALLVLSLAGLRRVPPRFRPWLCIGPLIFVQRYLVAGYSEFGVESLARYMMLATPALIVLAAWCAREWRAGTRAALIAGLILLQANWAFRFGLSEWAG
jgi:hypothetical protein